MKAGITISKCCNVSGDENDELLYYCSHVSVDENNADFNAIEVG